ncbi:phosphotransferase family protein [Corynebacterium variabile]|uniref:phosphotransferase family protein n=1 Tax=Corynebacterium variabile TaxID=1727 RepID=UPI0028A09927|nr:phosphotransferase family protein [Corynebacterium variabile]
MTAKSTASPFDTAALTDWLTSLPDSGITGPVELTRIGAGQSNLTYLATDDLGRSVVVRRPPLGHLTASAHDVLREGRIMAALADTDVPVPRIFGATTTAEEAPVIAMSVVDGTSLNSPASAALLTPDARRAAAFGLVDAMTAVHRVDLDETGLTSLASHKPYAPRQLRRWAGQWDQTKTRETPALEALTGRLRAAVPEQSETVLVHGDLHLGNIIVDESTGTVNAVVDWELTTLGDPMADIGSLLAYWPSADGPNLPGFDAALAEGFPTADELADRYLEKTGRSRDALNYWHVLGLWKVAIIIEGVLRRVRDTPENEATSGAPTAAVADDLIERATRIADATGL